MYDLLLIASYHINIHSKIILLLFVYYLLVVLSAGDHNVDRQQIMLLVHLGMVHILDVGVVNMQKTAVTSIDGVGKHYAYDSYAYVVEHLEVLYIKKYEVVLCSPTWSHGLLES